MWMSFSPAQAQILSRFTHFIASGYLFQTSTRSILTAQGYVPVTSFPVKSQPRAADK